MIGAVDNPRNAAKGSALMKYIAICGTVGSGKTTMLGKLLDYFISAPPFAAFRGLSTAPIIPQRTLVYKSAKR